MVDVHVAACVGRWLMHVQAAVAAAAATLCSAHAPSAIGRSGNPPAAPTAATAQQMVWGRCTGACRGGCVWGKGAGRTGGRAGPPAGDPGGRRGGRGRGGRSPVLLVNHRGFAARRGWLVGGAAVQVTPVPECTTSPVHCMQALLDTCCNAWLARAGACRQERGRGRDRLCSVVSGRVLLCCAVWVWQRLRKGRGGGARGDGPASSPGSGRFESLRRRRRRQSSSGTQLTVRGAWLVYKRRRYRRLPGGPEQAGHKRLL